MGSQPVPHSIGDEIRQPFGVILQHLLDVLAVALAREKCLPWIDNGGLRPLQRPPPLPCLSSQA